MTRFAAYLAIVLAAFAAIPALAVSTSFTYQGKLTDSTGQPVADGDYQLTFALCATAAGGTSVWTSSPTTVTAKGGLFTTTIAPSADSLSTYSSLWLETQVAGTPVTPRVKLNSAPFAFRAATADTVPDGSLTYEKLSGGAARAPFLAGVKSGLPWNSTFEIGLAHHVSGAVLAAPMTVEFDLDEVQASAGRPRLSSGYSPEALL